MKIKLFFVLFKATSNGIRLNWKFQKRCFWAIFVSVVLLYLSVAVSYSILEVFVELPEIPFVMSCKYSFVEFYRLIYLTQFVLASAAILLRFKKLNHCLENWNFGFDGKDTFTIAQLHRQLSDGIDILNETFTFQLIPIFASIIVSLTRVSCSILVNLTFFILFEFSYKTDDNHFWNVRDRRRDIASDSFFCSCALHKLNRSHRLFVFHMFSIVFWKSLVSRSIEDGYDIQQVTRMLCCHR